jgi:hypothetical protein
MGANEERPYNEVVSGAHASVVALYILARQAIAAQIIILLSEIQTLHRRRLLPIRKL